MKRLSLAAMNWMQLAIELTREAMNSRTEAAKPTEPTDLGMALSQQFGLIDRRMDAIVQNLKGHNAKLERSIRRQRIWKLYPGGRGRSRGGHRISALKACAITIDYTTKWPLSDSRAGSKKPRASISRTPTNDPNGEPPATRTAPVRTASVDNWNRSAIEILADPLESICQATWKLMETAGIVAGRSSRF